MFKPDSELEMALRPEDFRHAWPNALRVVMQLFEDSLARTEALSNEMIALRSDLNKHSAERMPPDMLKPAIDLMTRSHESTLNTIRAYAQEVMREQTEALTDLANSLVDDIQLRASESQDGHMNTFALQVHQETTNFKLMVEEQTSALKAARDALVDEQKIVMKAATAALVSQAAKVAVEHEKWLKSQQEQLRRMQPHGWLERLLWVLRGDVVGKSNKPTSNSTPAPTQPSSQIGRGIPQSQKKDQ